MIIIRVYQWCGDIKNEDVLPRRTEDLTRGSKESQKTTEEEGTPQYYF